MSRSFPGIKPSDIPGHLRLRSGRTVGDAISVPEHKPQPNKRKGSRFDGLNRGRIAKRGEMNATERKYAAELDAKKLTGEIVNYWFEPFSLRLTHPPEGQPARVTPDFLILMPSGILFIDDVKGSGVDNDASIVRMKCAAELYPLWRFRIVKQRTKKQGGGWDITEL